MWHMKVFEIVEFEIDTNKKAILGADKNGNLYIDNKKIITENVLKLNGIEKCAVIVSGFSTLGIFIMEITKQYPIIECIGQQLKSYLT